MARAPNISEINVPFMAFPLFQIGQCRAKVDVKGLAIDDERWHRLDACRLGFFNTVLLFAQVDDLDGIAGGIERIDELLLGRHTLRATRMAT